MKITKLGHCCLLVEEQGLRILADPGNYSTAQDQVKNIDIILITHEHADHLHVESLERVLRNNPQARIKTNGGAGKILREKWIAFELLTHGMSIQERGVRIEAYGEKHADIYRTISPVENTGYMIAGFFDPGDSFTVPGRQADILALPVVAPWLKMAEALDYAIKIKPRVCFPVHDGMLQPDRTGAAHRVPKIVLGEEGVEFIVLKDGEVREF